MVTKSKSKGNKGSGANNQQKSKNKKKKKPVAPSEPQVVEEQKSVLTEVQQNGSEINGNSIQVSRTHTRSHPLFFLVFFSNRKILTKI